ncbi:MAG: hypothetical protein MUE99_09770, partial [Chitinophagaceae bacterium]|nr:hypothetical protein [Chitinophagaceae bacterium]
MKKTILLVWGVFLFCNSLLAQEDYWPKEILLKTGGKILIYQPQLDELNGITLKGRTAVGGKEKMNDPMIYGALFFDAKLNTDKSTRMATLESVTITNAKMEGVDDQEKLKKMINLIETEVPKWNLDLSIDQIIATIKRNSGDGLMFNNTPPKIYYRDKPTSLIILDGEPKIKKDKDLDAERVLNSPNLIFKEGNQWNMYNGGTWYKSFEVTKGWVPETKMSAKVKSINDQIKKQEKEANGGKAPTEKPVVTDIIVSIEPAELIQTEGAPQYKFIEGTTIEYASNTKNDILKTTDGTIYILIAGRWYKSSSLNGPWTFNGADKMPPEFSKIPEGSAKDNVLVSISGTAAAEEAIIEAEIPQTAKVDRKTAKTEVEYDGNPKFETIEGTSLQLAENSNLTVLKDASGKYFALDNGVWFVGNGPKGPWVVADKRPEGLEAIPPNSPAYNAKFVYIYEVEKDYVVTGYTGGYLGTFVQGDPVVIFGTGFYYRPWYGSVYYPRPTTWGFNFSYNPWTGWTMGFGFNVGFLHIGFSTGPSYGYGGWFGPPYYRPPYRPPYYGGGYYGNRPGGGNNIIINGDVNIGSNNGNNIYNRPGNNGGGRPGIASRPPGNNNRPGSNYRPGNNNNGGNRPGNNNNNWNDRSSARPSTNNKNNVFTDKDGNVFQRDDKGNVNTRDNKGNSWKPADKSSPSVGNINRDAQARDRG